MAGDIVATYGLDDKALQAGLKRVEQSAANSVRKVESDFARGAKNLIGNWSNVPRGIAGGLAAAIAITAKAVKEFGKIDVEVGQSLDRFEAKTRKVFSAIGRDVGYGAARTADDVNRIIDAEERYRQAAVDQVAIDFGLGSDEARMLRQIPGLNQEDRRNKLFQKELMRSASRYSEAGGDTFGSGLYKARQDFEAEAARINAMDLDGSQKAELHATNRLTLERERARLSKAVADDAKREADAREKSAEAAIREAENRERSAEAARDELRGWAERRVDERQSLDTSAAGMRISNLRLAGMQREADIAEASREAEEARYRIRDSSLSAQEQASRLGEIDVMEAERIGLLQAKDHDRKQLSSNVLEAGTATGVNVRQALGGDNRLVAHAARTNALLTQIRDDGRRQSEGAVYAR